MVSPSTDIDSRTDSANAAAQVFAKYGDFIRTIIRYHIGNEVQADDLLQDFFLALVSNPVPPDIQNVKSYLYRAVTNDIIDATRRVERYRRHTYKYARRGNHVIDKTTPEDLFIEAEEKDKMFELIEMRLRHTEGQAITLRYRNNNNVKEVAERMKVSIGTARRYISVGLGKIRVFLTRAKAGYLE